MSGILLSLPNCAWADGNLAEQADHLGSNGRAPNFSSTKDSVRRAGPSCIFPEVEFVYILISSYPSQCKHTIPAVCMTRVGVGLNLLILHDGQEKVFTVDLVPALQVKVPEGFDGFQLRQALIMYYII